MQANTGQKNSEYRHFSHSVWFPVEVSHAGMFNKMIAKKIAKKKMKKKNS